MEDIFNGQKYVFLLVVYKKCTRQTYLSILVSIYIHKIIHTQTHMYVWTCVSYMFILKPMHAIDPITFLTPLTSMNEKCNTYFIWALT